MGKSPVTPTMILEQIAVAYAKLKQKQNKLVDKNEHEIMNETKVKKENDHLRILSNEVDEFLIFLESQLLLYQMNKTKFVEDSFSISLSPPPPGSFTSTSPCRLLTSFDKTPLQIFHMCIPKQFTVNKKDLVHMSLEEQNSLYPVPLRCKYKPNI
jgi:hypothetical protein